MEGLIITIFISLIGLLAAVYFAIVFVDLAKEHRRAKRRRSEERMEEEAAAIFAALAAFEKIRELEDKSDGNKKEAGNEEDKAL